MNRQEYNQYQQQWRKNNPNKIKAIRIKNESKPERKEYVKMWQKTSPRMKVIRKRYAKSEKSKQYQKDWIRNNPDKVKAKSKRYYDSNKGIVNYLKKRDRRKFKMFHEDLTIELIKSINDRDMDCIYCGKNLDGLKREYDHLNPFKPISKYNIVRCCIECNRSKGNANVFEWCNFKGYTPSELIKELYSKHLNSLKLDNNNNK
jgi:hypothetical protein